MTIKQLGGVFGRNPTFNDVTIEGELTFDGDIDINSDLKVSGELEVVGNINSTGRMRAAGGSDQGTQLNMWTTAGGDGSLAAYQLVFNTGPNDARVEGARFTPSGNLAFISGKGIDFSATAGTGTSELLDDYEEGVWTPAYTGASGSASYNVQSGTYTKVGREVTVIGELQASRNTLTGNITISGLPFASSGNGGGMLVTFAILFDSDMPNLRGYATSTSLSLRKQATNASGSTSVTASDLSIAAINHNYLYFSATYFTT